MDKKEQKLIVFTDLDGTLLDHDSYSFEAALPALERLKKNHVPVILTTSKTYSEVKTLQESLEIDEPCIVENGSAIYFSDSLFSTRFFSTEQKVFGKTYAEICTFLDQLPFEVKQFICGFHNMSVDEVAASTGLSNENAAKAKDRLASEPFLWTGCDEYFTSLKEALEEVDLSLLQGGRFYHILSKVDKANAIQWMMDCVSSKDTEADYHVVTLGDGPNDVKMLKAADTGIVIANPKGVSLSLDEKNIVYSNAYGPEGWCEEMNKLMDQLGLE